MLYNPNDIKNMSELEKLAFYSKIGHAVEHVAEKIGKGIKSAEKKLGANA